MVNSVSGCGSSCSVTSANTATCTTNSGTSVSGKSNYGYGGYSAYRQANIAPSISPATIIAYMNARNNDTNVINDGSKKLTCVYA